MVSERSGGFEPTEENEVAARMSPSSSRTRCPGSVRAVLLSDRDILAEIDAGRIVMEPWQTEMLQPSSIDVRLDRFFRVFENHRYPHIDPAADQSDLTRVVEPDGQEPFILHPGEFVLGSTYEVCSLPDDIAGCATAGRRRSGVDGPR